MNFELILDNLKKSHEIADGLQKKLEGKLNLEQLSEEEKEWFLGTRDYLRALEVATMEAKGAFTPAEITQEEIGELVGLWQKELASQQKILGGLVQLLQQMVDEPTENASLTDGQARRLLAAVKDILLMNNWQQKETVEILPAIFQQVPQVKRETGEKKSFLARLFGK
ncbi:hypothetical protein [Enterococcus timonensis]|uniref:hypothetical protein n=1 Tax=Enterococcus timonensis TaxID=1852364 RepID=UPI0008D9D01F|nr:hypothetical protein [Enterococcus timonensis]